jgi:hypothetical protein
LWFIARVTLLETSRRSSSPVMAGRAVPAE